MLRLFLLSLALVFGTAGTLAQEFPVTVKHVYGETTIEAAPERVLSLGLNDHDFLYALGVAPVGVRDWWGGNPYATWQWAEDERGALGATPEVLPGSEPNVEWVAAQKPDLIVAIYSDLSREMYAILSNVAPVILRPEGFEAYRAPWQAQLEQTSLAVTAGTEAAAGLISDLNEQAKAIQARYPDLVGKTASLADYRGGQVTLWAKEHAPTRFLESLGMVFPDELDAKADAEGWIYVSPENLELIDLDALVWPNGHKEALEDIALFRQLRLYQEGRSIHLPGASNTLAAALWFQTPLSLSYAMEGVAPLLSRALDGDPATNTPIPD